MSEHRQNVTTKISHGDCIEVMKTLPANSVDSIVTDPPYGLGFMGKAWDALPPGEDWARECLRVLKPGGHLLAFGGTRTWHRLAVAVEDAGFEIRDSIAWMYSQGFPKSLDVAKAIDKQRSQDRAPVDAVRSWLNERRIEAGLTHKAINEHFGHSCNGGGSSSAWMTNPTSKALPTTDQWESLKGLLGFSADMDSEVQRLNERKGTPGAIPIDTGVPSGRHNSNSSGTGQSIGHQGGVPNLTRPATAAAEPWQGWGTALKPAFEPIVVARKPFKKTLVDNVLEFRVGGLNIEASRHGDRWPMNVVLDERQGEALDESRFFYVLKPSKAEKPVVDGVAHPTVKPLDLMRWLVRMVTPAAGTVLDPFAGSGTTVEACIVEGFNCIAIEREAEYLPLIQSRIDRRAA